MLNVLVKNTKIDPKEEEIFSKSNMYIITKSGNKIYIEAEIKKRLRKCKNKEKTKIEILEYILKRYKNIKSSKKIYKTREIIKNNQNLNEVFIKYIKLNSKNMTSKKKNRLKNINENKYELDEKIKELYKISKIKIKENKLKEYIWTITKGKIYSHDNEDTILKNIIKYGIEETNILYKIKFEEAIKKLN